MVGIAAIALSTSFANVAHADPTPTLDPTGWAASSQTFVLSIGGKVPAGGFNGLWNSQAIVFWCIELTQFFNFGTDYHDYGVSAPDNAVMTLLGQLFTEAAADSTKDAKHSAAFQLAIWEIVYDSANLDLHGGALKVLNDGGHGDTVDLAQEWLKNLSKYTDDYNLFVLHSPSSQDFVTYGGPGPAGFRFNLVPEPSSIALLGLALLTLAGVLRRRRRQS